MKRHPSLIPFSKFHRDILFLALIAKKNAPQVKSYPTDIEGKIDYSISFYDKKLLPHFSKEETRLFKTLKGRFEKLDEIIAELEQERAEIKILFEKLKAGKEANTLHQIGSLLEMHVRKEERVFFQSIQDFLFPEELDKL